MILCVIQRVGEEEEEEEEEEGGGGELSLFHVIRMKRHCAEDEKAPNDDGGEELFAPLLTRKKRNTPRLALFPPLILYYSPICNVRRPSRGG